MLKNIFTYLLNKFINLSVGYYDNGLYRFEFKNNSFELVAAEPNYKAWFLIVSRNHYKEEQQEFQVTSKQEVKKLLKLNHPGDDVFSIIQKKLEQSTLANIWTFDCFIPKAFVTIPETLLLAVDLQDGFLRSIQTRSRDYFITVKNSIILSSVQTSVVKSPEYFSISVGCQFIKWDTLTRTELIHLLASNLIKLDYRKLSCLIKFERLMLGFSTVNKVLTPIVIFFTGYLMITSGYLYYKNHTLHSKLQSMKPELENVLDLQKNYDTQLSRFKAMEQFTAQLKQQAGIWLVLLPLYKDISITNLRYEQGRFEIRGSAAKATEILMQLSQDSRVEDAKFDFPTRRARDRDTFVISFMLNEKKLAQIELTNNNQERESR